MAADDKTGREIPGGRIIEADVLTTPGGHALPRVLDANVTMDLVQRYVETERLRNRRVMAVTVSIFIFVVLGLLTLFIAVGVFLLRNSRKATDIVEDLQAQTAVYAVEVVGMTNRMSSLETGQGKVKDSLGKAEQKRSQEGAVLKSDLERFSKWIASSNEKKSRSLNELQSQLKDLEDRTARREKEFEEMKEKYANLQALLAVAPWTASNRPAEAVVTATSAGVVDTPDHRMDTRASPTSQVEISEVLVEAEAGPRRDRPSEISVVTFPNGDRYEGEFKDGLMNGWGTYVYRNGDRYEGEFSGDMKNGKGTMVYRSGDRYVGEYRHDMKDGRGSCQLASGDKYVGEFSGDQMTGKGSMLYQNGNKYSGDFRGGLKHGNGVLKFFNGDSYEGDFKDDLREGRGTYLFSDGSKYIGEFKAGQRQGSGRYVYASGEEYVGDFVGGKKDGKGVCIYPNSKRMNGLWKEDRLVKVLED